MSVRNTFPQQRPTLNLDFANSKTLDPRITFSRTTTATYVDEDGLIKIASADESRFDHDPETGECLGLLVEEQRSNLITYSEDFDTWTKPGTPAGASISQDVTISPDGSNTADKIVESNTTGGHGIWKALNLPQTTTYTFSVFLKADERTWVDVRAYNSTNGNQFIAKIDLENGDFLENTGGTVKLDPFPNGWWRFSGVCSFNNIYTQFFIAPIISNNNASDTSYTGDGSSGLYIWGAQLEAGAFPTSYIPRPDTSAATRTPDNVSMTGDNFSDWYNQSEGTFEVSLIENGLGKIGGYPGVMYVDDGTGQNCIGFYISDAGDDGLRFEIYDGNVGQGNTPTIGVVSVGEKYNVIGAYASNDMVSTGGGLSVVNPDTSVVLPDVNRLIIGILRGGSLINMLNGTISKLTYYPTRLSNDQLQNLTK